MSKDSKTSKKTGAKKAKKTPTVSFFLAVRTKEMLPDHLITKENVDACAAWLDWYNLSRVGQPCQTERDRWCRCGVCSVRTLTCPTHVCCAVDVDHDLLAKQKFADPENETRRLNGETHRATCKFVEEVYAGKVPDYALISFNDLRHHLVKLKMLTSASPWKDNDGKCPRCSELFNKRLGGALCKECTSAEIASPKKAEDTKAPAAAVPVVATKPKSPEIHISLPKELVTQQNVDACANHLKWDDLSRHGKKCALEHKYECHTCHCTICDLKEMEANLLVCCAVSTSPLGCFDLLRDSKPMVMADLCQLGPERPASALPTLRGSTFHRKSCAFVAKVDKGALSDGASWVVARDAECDFVELLDDLVAWGRIKSATPWEDNDTPCGSCGIVVRKRSVCKYCGAYSGSPKRQAGTESDEPPAKRAAKPAADK